jgi:hypothetical protein
MKRIIVCSLLVAAALDASAPRNEPRGMFAIYAGNREQQRPNYVTEDFLLLSYSMILEEAVAGMEEKYAAPEMEKLVAGLRQSLAGGSEASRDFLAVLSALMDGSAPGGKAAEEVKLVRDAAGIVKSPLSGQTIDYTQFKPRGKYTTTPALSRYFQAMRYAGTVLFYVKESQATGVTPAQADALTRQAVEMARAIEGDAGLKTRYDALLAKFTWLFGPSEDLTAGDLVEAAQGEANTLRVRLLELARKKKRQPVILGGVIDASRLEKGVSASDAMTGWRLFPSRYTPDSAALQQLVYPSVSAFQGQGMPFTAATINGRVVKGFPRAAELMALLGSLPAAADLARAGDTSYEGYEAAAVKARAALSSGTGLAALHMGIIEYCVSRSDGRSPGRRLNTALSFWTLHRHQNLLYAKQSYTAAAKGFPIGGARTQAWIEPAPELYLLLHRAAVNAAAELESRALREYARLLDTCIEIAMHARARRPLSEANVTFLNGLDLELAELAGKTDEPVVADVHTEPNSKQVVEEGLASPKPAEVLIPGQGKKAYGALFRHREFKQPMDQRLTDEEWAARLRKEAAAQPPTKTPR